MSIEKIYFDVQDPFNSSLAINGFKELILKKADANRNSKLIYNKDLDDYLKIDEDTGLKKKRILIDEFIEKNDNFEYLPIFLKNAVVGIHFKKPRIVKFDRGNIAKLGNERKLPVLVNFMYSNFKHDPSPQCFLMGYKSTSKSKLIEGINLKYLTVSELRKIIQLSLKFPNMDMYYFYHMVLKPYSISKALGVKLRQIKNIYSPTREVEANKKIIETAMKLTPGFWGERGAEVRAKLKREKETRFKTNIKAEDTKNRKQLTGYTKTSNILDAYRKYHINKCHFYNIPVEFFNEKIE